MGDDTYSADDGAVDPLGLEDGDAPPRTSGPSGHRDPEPAWPDNGDGGGFCDDGRQVVLPAGNFGESLAKKRQLVYKVIPFFFPCFLFLLFNPRYS